LLARLFEQTPLHFCIFKAPIMAYADVQQLIDQMIRNQDDLIKPGQRDSALSRALAQYSLDAPRQRVADITQAVQGYTLPVPPDWSARSDVVSCEYPIAQRPVALINLAVYLTPTGYELLAEDSLPAGAVVRLTYTALHLLSASQPTQDTVPPEHHHALACLASHLLCLELATYFSGDREPTIGADVAQGQTRAQAYAARSRDLRGQYYAAIGKADPLARGSNSPLLCAARASCASSCRVMEAACD
jgi:hypothetical protein